MFVFFSLLNELGESLIDWYRIVGCRLGPMIGTEVGPMAQPRRIGTDSYDSWRLPPMNGIGVGPTADDRLIQMGSASQRVGLTWQIQTGDRFPALKEVRSRRRI